MGDIRRFDLLSAFLLRQFPRAQRFADVAGGRGYLSLNLALAGKDSVIFDPRPSSWAKRHRKRFREAAQRRIRRRREPWRRDLSKDFDVVVGLHPDGATRELAMGAHRVPTVIVPCCNHWSRGSGPVEDLVRNAWGSIGLNWWETDLGMEGKSLALISLPPG